MNVRITSAAQADLTEALRWYRERQRGLDQRFLASFDLSIEALLKHPELGPVVVGRVRRYLLKGFPYAVFYLLEESEIVVVACLHGARDPAGWPDPGAA